MEEYLLQGPSAYKRPRLGENPSNFLDARSNMVPFGFVATQDSRDSDMNMAAMPMGGNLALNPVQDFGQLAVPDWRHAISPDSRYRFVHKITQALTQNARNGESSDNRFPKWIAAARKIEGKAFKTAVSRSQYFDLMKEEINKIHMGYGFPAMSSQFLPSSSTTSATAANNLHLINMPQYQGPNSFGEPVTATQSHSQANIAHSATSVNLFPDDTVGNPMRIPVTSSIGSARPQFDAFNGRQPGPRGMVHDQVTGSGLSLGFPGDPSQFMSNADQVLGPNLLHSMNALIGNPLSQFMSSSAVGSQQPRNFGLNDNGQGVLSENSSVINSQGSGRLQSKEWHKSVTFNVRNSLIRKMAQILSTTPDPQAGSLENKMHNCISIATSVENETYRTANSMSQYYDLMAKRCHFIAKERASTTQPGIQYYNLSDIRRTYEALGIAYPMGQSSFPSGNNPTAGNMRLHGNDVNGGPPPPAPPPPPPPGVLPNLMSSAVPPPPPPYCAFARNPAAAAVQQANHNQLLGTESSNLQVSNRFLQGAIPLSLDAAEIPEVIKQLAHAYKCQERENQENDVMLLCSLPHCRETKDLLNHITTCQAGITCCGSTKEIIDHWNRCSVAECPICLPVRQAERNLNATAALAASPNNQLQSNPFMRRPHRSMGSNYPSTATSGLLSNQSQNGPPNNNIRNERISPRSSMWHSNYNDSWRSPNNGQDMSMDNGGRRSQPRFWVYNRNIGNRHERRAPYNNPWAAPEIIFVDNPRGQPPRGASLFGPIGSGRNMDRLQPYGAPWRSPDILFVENVRPAHRQAQDSDEPVIIPPEEDATPTEHQQMMAIVKVVKTAGGRLEQKFRCSRRSCSASWPCLHRRLAASIQSQKTPIPG